MEKQCRASKERCTLKGGEKWEGNKVKRETRQKIEESRGSREEKMKYASFICIF